MDNSCRLRAQPFNSIICLLCHNVLTDPVAIFCGHRFCRQCLMKWCNTNTTCPIDLRPLIVTDFRDVLKGPNDSQESIPSPLICCSYRLEGCRVVVYSDALEKHQKNCFYNPNKLLFCQKNCSKLMTREERKSHICDKKYNKFRLIIIFIVILLIIIIFAIN